MRLGTDMHHAYLISKGAEMLPNSFQPGKMRHARRASYVAGVSALPGRRERSSCRPQKNLLLAPAY
jgi:hypothetical protein